MDTIDWHPTYSQQQLNRLVLQQCISHSPSDMLDEEGSWNAPNNEYAPSTTKPRRKMITYGTVQQPLNSEGYVAGGWWCCKLGVGTMSCPKSVQRLRSNLRPPLVIASVMLLNLCNMSGSIKVQPWCGIALCNYLISLSLAWIPRSLNLLVRSTAVPNPLVHWYGFLCCLIKCTQVCKFPGECGHHQDMYVPHIVIRLSDGSEPGI